MSELPHPETEAAIEQRYLNLPDAARLVGRLTGREPCIPTLWRWATKGLNGVRLDYVRVGRRICVTRQAVEEFFTRLAHADQDRAAKAVRP